MEKCNQISIKIYKQLVQQNVQQKLQQKIHNIYVALFRKRSVFNM